MAGRFRLYTDTDIHGPVYAAMSAGDFVAAFEELARRDDPFAAYPIVHIKPTR